MNSNCTVDILNEKQVSQVVLISDLQDNYSRKPEKLGFLQIARVAGLTISLAVSPITAIPDPWLDERKRRDSVVSAPIYQNLLGRLISRSEALQISRQILKQAEQERFIFAELEAKYGVQWED